MPQVALQFAAMDIEIICNYQRCHLFNEPVSKRWGVRYYSAVRAAVVHRVSSSTCEHMA